MLDMVQQRHRQGPCLDAARDIGIVQVEDLRADARWPAYRRETLQRTPIRSVLSVALVSDEEVLGALNIFSETPRAFDAEAVDIAQFFAINAALAWSSVRREMRHRRSLDSHDIVGQAKGVLMERYGLSSEDARSLLRRLSEQSDIPVTEASRRLLTKPSHGRVSLHGRTPAQDLETRRRMVREATRC